MTGPLTAMPLKMWSLDKGPQHHLGLHYKCKSTLKFNVYCVRIPGVVESAESAVEQALQVILKNAQVWEALTKVTHFTKQAVKTTLVTGGESLGLANAKLTGLLDLQ